MRRRRARRPRSVYVGQYAARELSKHDYDHRSAWAVYRATWRDGRAQALWRRTAENPRRPRGHCVADHAAFAWSCLAQAALDWKLLGSAAGAGVRELGAGGEAGAPGHELP